MSYKMYLGYYDRKAHDVECVVTRASSRPIKSCNLDVYFISLIKLFNFAVRALFKQTHEVTRACQVLKLQSAYVSLNKQKLLI